MKRNPIINDGLEKAIGTIIGTLKKGTHFTTQDITGKLKESYREEYKKNEESIREDIKYMFHAFIGGLMLKKSVEYRIVKDNERGNKGKVKGMNVNGKMTKSQAWTKE